MKPEKLFLIFERQELTFFSGVPDSTFKGWMSFLSEAHGRKLTHLIACNECEAVALAAGYHLVTGKIGTVYLQNSGEGKTVNPLTSLCDREVYSIPLIMMIGWRGQPGQRDEPQHRKMGRITLPLLDVLEIPHFLLPGDQVKAEKTVAQAKEIAASSRAPVALIIREDVIDDLSPDSAALPVREMSREEAIQTVVDILESNAVIVSTTGKTSRELFEYRLSRGDTPRDFYTVGSMGCAASIAHAIAMTLPDRSVYIFDGDGALLMQLGSLATIGHYGPPNLRHIVFDNAAHDSTGGQPTVSPTVDFAAVARACGYHSAVTAETRRELKKIFADLRKQCGPAMVVVKVKKGSRKSLGRPTATPIENKERFMEWLRK
jgi:phosphonopyruvate decarboxylase